MEKGLLSEFDSLLSHEIFVIEDGPKKYVKPIYMHLTNSEKRDEQGHVVKKKSRLVVNGSAQSREDSHFETFAPVLTRESFRLIIAKAAQEGWTARQFDVETAFLLANLPPSDFVIIRPPAGFGTLCEARKIPLKPSYLGH